MTTYARLPVAFAKGTGAYLEDTNGKRYLDALTGLAVCGLGHAHPAVTEAISSQAAALLHTSNLYEIPLQAELAVRLVRLSGMDNVFFANSGAEANEAAIKLARLHGHKRGINKPAVIAADGSFHGRTMATLTATGNRKVHAGFEPLLTGFVRAPFDNVAAIEQIAANNADVAAVLVEPIQGEGGINIPATDYLEKLRAICDANDWLLILDEVQTGNARTGKYFAYQHTSILPDVLTTAKGLGNGVPIGACLARGEAATLFQPGHHASTFGGNPLVCAAANAVVKTIEEEGLAERAAELGDRMLSRLANALKGDNRIEEIRGKGLMIAIELNQDCSDLVNKGLDAGILINVTQGNILRLLPPLILSDEQADEVVDQVVDLING
ncbi:MAG: aspartate aminotransferase family protein [Pseudomonadales bacterium]|nr:aspartate aminotransferase family protein [Pseudomonadales bacterium]MDP6472009.1 aspartate aminotransferase family protein [Pseudomonadales bacterium]MDP6826718.1 aspartate aminotransferase family protein [Pseudomonadales bacterium]MDP6972652.1 aspartate aminotransferase family protein [Pseudomonadales bacterium]